MDNETNELGRVVSDEQALVNEAATHLHPAGFDPSRGTFEFADKVIAEGFAKLQAQQSEMIKATMEESARLREALVTIRTNAMRTTTTSSAAFVSFCDMGLREVLQGSTLNEAYKVWDAYQKCSACGAASGMLGNGLCFACTPEGKWPSYGEGAQGMETGTAETLAAPGDSLTARS